MKIKTFLVSFILLISFPVLAFAKDELLIQKEVMYWTILKSHNVCSDLIDIEVGKDVPDLRDEPACGRISAVSLFQALLEPQ